MYYIQNIHTYTTQVYIFYDKKKKNNFLLLTCALQTVSTT